MKTTTKTLSQTLLECLSVAETDTATDWIYMQDIAAFEARRDRYVHFKGPGEHTGTPDVFPCWVVLDDVEVIGGVRYYCWTFLTVAIMEYLKAAVAERTP